MTNKKKLSDKRKLREFFRGVLADCRTEPPACRHFGDCGGCEFQDVPYERQLRAKRQAFDFILAETAEGLAGQVETDLPEASEGAGAVRHKADLLRRAFSGIDVGVVRSPSVFGYRQRMDYVFAFGRMGLRRMNRHRQVVELGECPILGDAGFSVVRKARSLADAAGVESYDYLRHTGELRYFVLRQSRNGQRLLSLVTKSEHAGKAVLGILRRLFDAGDIASGYWLVAPGLGDVSFGRELAHVGEPFIVEETNGFHLRIGPNTFFQSNPAVAEKAYAAMRDFTPAGSGALDMYSGVGSIAVNVSPAAAKVTAVENIPENVTLAEINFRENGIGNASIAVDDSARYLAGLTAGAAVKRPDMVIVNPPRPGVEGGGMAAIAALEPKRLAYLSCNSFTLFRNLADIMERYRLVACGIYDMFPQTRHFESLALLERI